MIEISPTHGMVSQVRPSAPFTAVMAFRRASGSGAAIQSTVAPVWGIGSLVAGDRFNFPPPSTRWVQVSDNVTPRITVAYLSASGDAEIGTNHSASVGGLNVGAGFVAGGPLSIGQLPGSPTGDMLDLFIFGRELSAEEKQTLFAYLEAKHAIS